MSLLFLLCEDLHGCCGPEDLDGRSGVLVPILQVEMRSIGRVIRYLRRPRARTANKPVIALRQ